MNNTQPASKIIAQAIFATLTIVQLSSCANTENTKSDAVKEKVTCTDVNYSGYHGKINTFTRYTYNLKEGQNSDAIPQDSSGLESIDIYTFNEDGTSKSSESYIIKNNTQVFVSKTITETINSEKQVINYDKDGNVINKELRGTINDSVYNTTILGKSNKIEMRIFNKIKDCNPYSTTTEIYNPKTEKKESSIVKTISFDRNGNMIQNDIQAYDESGNEVAGMKMKATYDIIEIDKYDNPVKVTMTGTSPMEQQALRKVTIAKITYY